MSVFAVKDGMAYAKSYMLKDRDKINFAFKGIEQFGIRIMIRVSSSFLRPTQSSILVSVSDH